MSRSSRTCPCAVSATRTSTPASINVVARSHASPKYPIAAPTIRRPCASFDACGNCSDLTKSFTVIRPCSRPSSSTSGSRSRLCLRSRDVASSREIPTGPVMSGLGVITSSTLVVPHSATGTKRRSRLVMMPSKVLVGVDDGQAGQPVLAADLVQLLEGGVGADRHRVGDDPGLGPLDQVHLVGLVGDGQVPVKHPESTLAGHGDGHPGLGDGVHGCRDERNLERDLPCQPRGRVDLRRNQVGLTGKEKDVVEGQANGCERLGNDGIHGTFRKQPGGASHCTGDAGRRPLR